MREGGEKKRKGKERKGTEGAAVDINSKFGPFFFIFLFFVFPFWSLERGDYYFLFPVQLIAATTFLVCKV